MTARTHLQPELPGTANNSEDIFSAQESIIFSEFNLHNIKDNINFNMKYMSNNISASIIITIVEQCIILLNVRLFGGKDPCRRLPGWSCDRKMRELIKTHLEGSTACQQLFEVASPPNRPLGSQKTSRFGRALCRQKNQGRRSFSAKPQEGDMPSGASPACVQHCSSTVLT